MTTQFDIVLARDRRCQLIGRVPNHVCPKDPINGRLTVMHIPPKSWVERRWKQLWLRADETHLTEQENRFRTTPLADLASDPDLAMLACWGPHHSFDYQGKRFDRDLLPEFIEQRVSWYGLEPELERLFRDVRLARKAA